MTYAEDVTISITAEVASVDDRDDLLHGNINIGDIITGTYTYNTNTTDSNLISTVGNYQHNVTPYGIILNTDSYVFQTNPNNVNFLVQIVNDHNVGRDNYLLRSYNNIVLGNILTVDHISWQLDDDAGNALSSTLLTDTAPILSDWESIFGLTITGPEMNDEPSFSNYFIRAHVIDAVISTSTPILDTINDKSVDEENSLVFLIIATDADSDPISFGIDTILNFTSFVDNGDDTATFLANPGISDSGVYNFNVTATDGTNTDYELFTLTVNDVQSREDGDLIPAITIDRNGYVGIGTEDSNSRLQITDGYLQLDTISGAPPLQDCDSIDEYGRMKVDNTAGTSKLYVCTPAGWLTLQ